MTTMTNKTMPVSESEYTVAAAELDLDTAPTARPQTDATWFLACLEYAGPRGSMRHTDEARLAALMTEMAAYAAE